MSLNFVNSDVVVMKIPTYLNCWHSPINDQFIGIFELFELEVDNKESNAEKPGCHNNKIRYIFFKNNW